MFLEKRKVLLAGLGILLLLSCGRANAQSSNAATFFGSDPLTQGNWKGNYGAEGYSIANDSQSIPSYATFAIYNQANYTWTTSTTDPRALQTGSGSGRIAAAWYQSSSFYFDVNITDGKWHQFALYALDWDAGGRAETIQVLDASTQAVLDTRAISGFSNGLYLVWNISGHVKITVTRNSGSNAVVSGVFWDPDASTRPYITSLSPAVGVAGTSVTFAGSNFGSTQGTSTVTFNGASASATSWNDTQIVAAVPSGASSGMVLVTAGGKKSNFVYFSVLPSGWSDQDIGAVGVAGSASFSNGAFTVSASGQSLYGSSDKTNFVYQSLSGDGSIVARVANQTGSSPQAGVMIRETLDPGSKDAFAFFTPSQGYLYYRTTAGATTGYQSVGLTGTTYPYWFKVARSGNSFTGYVSVDGLNWTQIGASQTITMAQNVYIGLILSNSSNTSLATATFDNVSVSSTASPAPAITGISNSTGSIGSLIEITGSGFGSSQGNSIVYLNGLPVTIEWWDDTSIVITIPSGASSGLLVVSVAPSMNDSNSVPFEVTTQPLPAPWEDIEIGPGGVIGGATFSKGTFAVGGSNQILNNSSDTTHFVYQPLSGDGSIVARVASLPGSYPQAGVMIRETLDAGSRDAYVYYSPNESYFVYRTTTGAYISYQMGGALPSGTHPYWVKLTRSGNSISGYVSMDGVYWTQVGSSVTITMAQNVYIGLSAGDNSKTLTAATFDNVSVSSTSAPAPVITGLSATTGSIGSQVVISGSGFGSSQGNSVVYLNGVAVTIDSWSANWITFTVPSGATSGYLVVSVAPSMNDSNAVSFTVTTQPLPAPWVDQDVGQPGDVGAPGSATYSSGVFTVTSTGLRLYGSSDGFHFLYQALSGDGTIVARVNTIQGGTNPQAGAMIRETMDPGSTDAFVFYSPNESYMYYRTTAGASSNYQMNGSLPSGTHPYWVKLTRSGNSISGYVSMDGVYWTQVGSSVTITMAQNVYVGLAVASLSTTQVATVTFDNVSVSSGSPYPTPVVSSISPTSAGPGYSITIAGSSFGNTQNGGNAYFNGTAAASITSWSDTQVVATVPNTATTGPVTVVANGVGSNRTVALNIYNPIITSVTPAFAAVGGSVVLGGSGFTSGGSGCTVQFNGINANTSNWSDTSVTAVVPSGATSGSITVSIHGVVGAGAAFNLIGPVSVTDISPASGPAGTPVIISGSGFGPQQSTSTVSFSGLPAAGITSWSDTQIVAVVPAFAPTGSLFVDVANVIGQGPAFTLTTSLSLTDSLNNQTTYQSVLEGGEWRPLQVQGSGCSSCTTRGNISYTYDSAGNALSKTDELGRTTTYTYDANGNVLTMTVPLTSTASATTTYTYNSFGEVLTATDPLGNVTTNTYDANGNLLSVTTPAPNGNTAASVTQFSYDTKGELTSITDPLNNVTTLTYTSAGLIATITDAQSNVTTYAYDAHGNRTSATDALHHQTTFAYDSGDRLTTITYPDSTTTTFAYDYRGRRTSVTDQNGKTTTYAYDDADRLTSVTDAANNVTRYAYDTENNLTSITDANSHTTSFAYDAFGRVTQTTFPSSAIETYAYDAVGNLTGKTDRKNQAILYAYDLANRLTQKTYPDSTTVNYTYDNDSRLTQVSDPTGTYQLTFDNMGRLIGTTTSYSFLTGRNFTTSYTYDKDSNRTGFTDPENGSTTYAYDALNRLTTLTPPSAFTSGSFGFSYDALSRRTGLTRPNYVTTSYTYDNLSRLLSVLHQLSGSTIDGATYTVDNAGNRTAKTDWQTGVTSNYSYDAIYELTSVLQGANTTESYTYDPVGNRLSSLGVSPYSYNVSNELTSTPNATYGYDNNGNAVTKNDSTGITTYAWDFENRLTSVTLPAGGGTVTFAYDPFGRRIEKASSAGTSIYAYDGDNLIEETNSSGAVVARYSQGLNIDEPLAMLRSGATDFYEADGLGTTTSLTSTAGALAQTYTFDSFGKQTGSSGSLTNPFQYTGREFDGETSLYYYRARYYDPGTGRFLSEDPLRFGVGTTIRNLRSSETYRPMTASALRGRSGDFFSYVSNGPIGGGDPRGLWQATIGGGHELGGLVTFGQNNGHWNIGVYVGAGEGLFGSLDPDNVDCTCGVNAHAEGDLGIIGLEGVGGALNIDQNGDSSATLTLSDPEYPNRQWTWDPSAPEPPHPAFGAGAGIFSGVGYTECF